jgi:hypothetical protein
VRFKEETVISLIVIGVIFLWWLKKRPAKKISECSNLWDDMENANAQTFYFSAISLAENDADLRSRLVTEAAQTGANLEYTQCKYAAKYVAKHNEPKPVITEGEYQRILTCMCEKLR